MAAADGQDAASGALGAVVGEVAADAFSKELKEKLESGTMTPKEVESWIGRGVDISKLTAGLAAAAVGGDVNTAAHTGGNAAENNCYKGLLAVIYSAVVGKGDLKDGLAEIGRGDDPLSKAINGVIVGGVKLAAEAYPQETKFVIELLSEAGGLVDATITYFDEKTGGYVSTTWSAIPKDDRDAILGLVTVVSLDTNAIKKVAGLKQTAVELKTAEKARSAAQKVRLSNQLTAEAISTGHAFSKHAKEFNGIGVRTSAELQTLIENTMSKPSLTGPLQNGRSFYFNAENRVVVIVNPSAADKGTAFVIDKARYPNPMNYIKTLR